MFQDLKPDQQRDCSRKAYRGPHLGTGGRCQRGGGGLRTFATRGGGGSKNKNCGRYRDRKTDNKFYGRYGNRRIARNRYGRYGDRRLVRSVFFSRGPCGVLRTRTLANVLEGPWHATAHNFRVCLFVLSLDGKIAFFYRKKLLWTPAPSLQNHHTSPVRGPSGKIAAEAEIAVLCSLEGEHSR